jgi:hypothetical protein
MQRGQAEGLADERVMPKRVSSGMQLLAEVEEVVRLSSVLELGQTDKRKALGG